MTPASAADLVVDTIVAPATAPGQGQRAMVRLSGSAARTIAFSLVTVTREPSPGCLGDGWFDLDPAWTGVAKPALSVEQLEAPVPVELLVFRAPHSLTGEDVVELHLPGWPALVSELVRRCVAAGARPAARGEFMRRALVHGRVDLEHTLAVGRLAGSRAAEEARAAAACLTRRTARSGAALRDVLLATLALLEAHVDFEETDTEGIDESDLRAGLQHAETLARELVTAGAVRAYTDGETDVVLLGPPNAGKSSLFLALCPGAETTISPQQGTTRDALSALVDRGGRRWRLIDGPGVGEVHDALDELAAECFLQSLPAAAVVLHVEPVVAGCSSHDPVVDALPSIPSEAETAARRRRLQAVGDRAVISVSSKCDLLSSEGERPAGLATSAVTGEGLSALWEAVLAAAPAPRAPDLAELAESEAAADVLPLLEAAQSERHGGALPELAMHLRDAIERLESEREKPLNVTDEVLDRIFASFCIGK